MSDLDIRSFEGKIAKVSDEAYVDKTACLIGDVTIGKESSIWPMAVLRGDVNFIKIGERTNIQDGSVLHVTDANEFNGFVGKALVIGDGITIGHRACLHGCTLQDGCFIGMGATVMDGAVVESGAMVAAGALVSENKVIEAGWLYAGVPAKKLRQLSETEKIFIANAADKYVKFSKELAANSDSRDQLAEE